MKASHRFLVLGLLAASSACSQQTVSVQLHPLQSSGDVTFVCRVDSADPLVGSSDQRLAHYVGEGRPLDECNPASVYRGERNLFALVTQVLTGEVAVLNVPLDPAHLQAGEGFVDITASAPGYGFLHIGSQPGQIVSTPGGVASFVGVGEVGKPGIYALPTSCVARPSETEFDRDLTTWPACSLPAVPGPIVVTVDPPVVPDGIARSCDRSQGFEEQGVPESTNSECPADLSSESGPRGRRKLLVALPDLGKIAVIDAQSLLNRAAGSFGPCDIEAELALQDVLPVTQPPQVLPDDLLECGSVPLPVPPRPDSFDATPSDFDLSEGKLYVADSTAPLVHVVNAEQPCALAEGPPLLTRALESPDRVVTTSKVAVSPLSPSGHRFVYAIDQYDSPVATVMMFDVSPGSTNPTPIVRPRSIYLPFEPPDRIQFTGAPRDITFVLRDRPQVDPITGNVVVGTQCEPDPAKSNDPGALYRPASDYSSGARSTELRGLFASVALTSGQVAMVDVEDFDAPCRRPRTTNTEPLEDFRGCRADAVAPGTIYQSPEGERTVTDEVSCRMVEPHRQRSANMGLTGSTTGVHAPSLRALPQLRVPETAAQGNFKTWPKLLAVDFAGASPGTADPAQVYVNTTLYKSDSTGADALKIQPAEAAAYSLTLPFNEPRAYPVSNDMSLIYEGPVTGTLRNGFLETSDEDSTLAAGTMRLRDPSAGYCDSGVSDYEVMTEYGQRRFGLSGTELDTFAKQSSDYVVITSDYPAAEDPYWRDGDLTCNRPVCETAFGKIDAKTLSPARDFKIVDAQQQILMLEPRRTEGEVGDDVLLVHQARCCFPSGTQYVVRASQQWVLRGTASGFRHQVIPVKELDANGQEILNCRRDCNPRKHFFESRVFEISRPACAVDKDGKLIDPTCPCVTEDCAVGNAPAHQTYCIAEDAPNGVQLNETAANCILETVTDRLVVYRGPQPSVRDMAFTWQIGGGFFAQRIDLTGLSVLTSPRTLVDLPQFSWLVLIDGGALGLVQISMDALGPLIPPLN